VSERGLCAGTTSRHVGPASLHQDASTGQRMAIFAFIINTLSEYFGWPAYDIRTIP
jgi:hypothetical protein